VTDAAAFLAAIAADPDTDGLRLAYADWLDEHGDTARAEFIRVQCALAKVDEDNRDIHPLAARERELLKRHRDEWLRPLKDLLGGAAGLTRWRQWAMRITTAYTNLWAFRRGFAELLATVADLFLPRAAEVTRATPLRSLRLGYYPRPGESSSLASLADCPHLGGLTELEVNCSGQLDDLGRLVASPHVARVERFAAEAGALNHVAALVGSPFLGRLRALSISAPIPTSWADGYDRLFACPSFLRLEGLTLSQRVNPWDPEQPLPELPAFERLTRLDLSGNPFGDVDLGPVLGRLPPTLRRLDLSHTRLGDYAVRGLVRSPLLRSLKSLKLARNRVTDGGALDLADSPFLLAPTRLDLTGNPLSEQVRRALRIRLGDRVKV
jgi:uncharacterized protein (TIGR02996 family)